jgi:hypothetical protein
MRPYKFFDPEFLVGMQEWKEEDALGFMGSHVLSKIGW